MLTTLDIVKDELGITDDSEDTRLTRYITQASARIESEVHRSLEYQEGIVESVPALGWKYIPLARRPVVSVSSVTFAGSTVDADEYSLDSEAGLLFRANGWPWDASLRTGLAGDKVTGTEQSRIEVTYDGGYVTPAQAAEDDTLTRTLPYDLEGVAIQLVVLQYRARGESPAVSSEKLGDASVTYARGIRGMPSGLLDDLTPYVAVI